jgi:hypothetical protein
MKNIKGMKAAGFAGSIAGRLLVIMMTLSVILGSGFQGGSVFACEDCCGDNGYPPEAEDIMWDEADYWEDDYDCYEMDGFIDYPSEGVIRNDIFEFVPETPVVSSDNAFLKTAVHNYGRRHVDTVGLVLYDEWGDVIISEMETCDRGEGTFYIFYDLNEELYTYLDPSTDYQYAFYIEYDGEFYTHEMGYFRTN